MWDNTTVTRCVNTLNAKCTKTRNAKTSTTKIHLYLCILSKTPRQPIGTFCQPPDFNINAVLDSHNHHENLLVQWFTCMLNIKYVLIAESYHTAPGSETKKKLRNQTHPSCGRSSGDVRWVWRALRRVYRRCYLDGTGLAGFRSVPNGPSSQEGPWCHSYCWPSRSSPSPGKFRWDAPWFSAPLLTVTWRENPKRTLG